MNNINTATTVTVSQSPESGPTTSGAVLGSGRFSTEKFARVPATEEVDEIGSLTESYHYKRVSTAECWAVTGGTSGMRMVATALRGRITPAGVDHGYQ